jgi:predicted NodU family carbamoyl transferase
MLPSAAIHVDHNASIALYYDNDILEVIEIERFINQKNAELRDLSQEKNVTTILPLLKEVSSYIKQKYNFNHYEKLILSKCWSSYSGDPRNSETFLLGSSLSIYFKANEIINEKTHQELHASNTFYQSPFNESIIVSFDGGGSDGWFNIYKGVKGKELELLFSSNINLGRHYSNFGVLLEPIKNFNYLSAPGKFLGLQSYGRVINEWKPYINDFFKTPTSPVYGKKEFKERIPELMKQLNLEYNEKKLEGELAYNFARTVQEVFEDIVFELITPYIDQFKNLPVCITGGCALNIVLNAKIKERVKNIFIAPNSSDCGIAVGSLCKHFKPTKQIDITYKGVDVLDRICLASYVKERKGQIVDIMNIAEDLSNNLILGVVRGRSEHGPRALGNRSIVCSPIDPNMKDILNKKVKNREWFRPFAPIVRLEDASLYFEMKGESRWMNYCFKVKGEYRDKLKSITHIDGTARVQTVTREQNGFMYDLLTKFKDITGVGVLLNTSFNVSGRPILTTYKDAFKVFDETELDRLYLDGFYFNS